MELLHTSECQTEYSRVELYDKEKRTPPQTPMDLSDDELRVFFDAYGVVASCQADTRVIVKVYEGKGLPSESPIFLIKEGMISVGEEGIFVGDSISAESLHILSWPAGTTNVQVYLDTKIPWSAKTVVFVLSQD